MIKSSSFFLTTDAIKQETKSVIFVKDPFAFSDLISCKQAFSHLVSN